MKNPTVQLFEAYKDAMGVHTDCAAADALGVKNQTVNNWRNRGSQAEPRLIQRMCTKLGADSGEWVLRAQLHQAPDARNKRVWRLVAKQFGYKIAAIGLPLAAITTSAMVTLSPGDSGLSGWSMAICSVVGIG